MIFARTDDLDSFGNQRVNYILADSPGFDFQISITKNGVQFSGITPNFTDFIEINRVIVWASYQRQSLITRNAPIPQHIIDSGRIW